MQKGVFTSFESSARLVSRPRSLSEPFLRRRNPDANETYTIPNPLGLSSKSMAQPVEGGTEPAEIALKPPMIAAEAMFPSSTIAKDDGIDSHTRQIDGNT